MYMYYFLGHQLMDNPSLTDAQKEVGQVIGEDENCRLRRCCIKVRAENTFLLALDGDVDFQPEAIIKVSEQVFFSKLQEKDHGQVVDLMKRNPDVGAACGRIHPTGSGYMQWCDQCTIVHINIFVGTHFTHQHNLSGTRSLSMQLDTGFRRQQSTCLAVFSAGKASSAFSTEFSDCHQPRMFLPVPSEGSDGRECDAHLHHRCQPAQALCPVRPGKGSSTTRLQ